VAMGLGLKYWGVFLNGVGIPQPVALFQERVNAVDWAEKVYADRAWHVRLVSVMEMNFSDNET
jgi:hypothetical protein